MSELRQNAQYHKFEATPEARKRWVIRMLSRHLGFYFGMDDLDRRFCCLMDLKKMTPEQRDLLGRISRPILFGRSSITPDEFEIVRMSLVFPDGRVIELKKNLSFIDIRESGGEWQGTLLKSAESIMEWIVLSGVRLLEDHSK